MSWLEREEAKMTARFCLEGSGGQIDSLMKTERSRRGASFGAKRVSSHWDMERLRCL